MNASAVKSVKTVKTAWTVCGVKTAVVAAVLETNALLTGVEIEMKTITVARKNVWTVKVVYNVGGVKAVWTV